MVFSIADSNDSFNHPVHGVEVFVKGIHALESPVVDPIFVWRVLERDDVEDTGEEVAEDHNHH